jgi:alpha-beta hydrolase superfamily lysophospholipase
MQSYVRVIWIAAALAVAGCNQEETGTVAAPPPPITVTYSYVNGTGSTVILLSTSAKGTMTGETATMARLTADLSDAGFGMLAIDLPCHGDDAEDIQPLACWRRRIESGDTQIFLRFCAQLSAVITHLGLNEAFIVGESRGGYVAAVCTARDMRITKVALLKPVTNLQLLAEFSDYSVDRRIFGLASTVRELSNRPAMLRIGTNDTRVGTASAIRYGTAIGAEIQVVESEGHKLIDDGTTTAWLLKD